MNRTKRISVVVYLTILLIAVPAAHATKPCQPSPCENSAGQFDRAKCVSSADWVAQGTITKVTHHREGHPTNKDFAEFTFTAVVWEKKRMGAANTFRFTVGWCENRQELPLSTVGMFRVFGLASRMDMPDEPGYLYLEPIVKK